MQLPILQPIPDLDGSTEPMPGFFRRPDQIEEAKTSPQDVVKWSMARFTGWNAVTTTAFGMEGCMLLHLLATSAAEMNTSIRVLYIDTHFFFKETYDLRDRMIERYPSLKFERVTTHLSEEEQAEEFGPRLWETRPDLCCKLRKVDPLVNAMRDVDVWFAGIGRGQSKTRARTTYVSWDNTYQVIKVSPLAYMSRPEVWEFIQANNVPYNELHEKEYPSIGCTHCTTPVPGAGPADYSRDGRWRGKQKTECGLHLHGKPEPEPKDGSGFAI